MDDDFRARASLAASCILVDLADEGIDLPISVAVRVGRQIASILDKDSTSARLLQALSRLRPEVDAAKEENGR